MSEKDLEKEAKETLDKETKEAKADDSEKEVKEETPEEVIAKLEKDLEEFYSFDEIMNEYKTQEVMHMERNTILKNSYEKNSQERYEYGFIDFFIMKNLGEI